MKLWGITSVRDDSFARASRVGTWVKQGDPPRSVRVQPMVIEWEPSSTVVGDFTWVGVPDEYIIKRSVGEEILAAGFKGFELGPVEMVPNRDDNRRKRNMIQLPYKGPEVADWWVTKSVSLNRDRSTVRVVRHERGKPILQLEGGEHTKLGEFNRETMELEKIHIPRTPGMGLYVDAGELGGSDVFIVKELGGYIKCTDRLRDFILDKGYTNIEFFEVGETTD